MSLQNRVLPTGEIVAIPLRGDFLGNRGNLHDAHYTLGVSRWTHQAWVTCETSFKGRRRTLMTPGRYTELFFYDEAVALAAGHRPCGECRRDDFNTFCRIWRNLYGPMSLKEIDQTLHAARVTRTRAQVTHEATGTTLPFGTFIEYEGQHWLIQDKTMRAFDVTGYGEDRARANGPVTVLTPTPTVAVLAGGYHPQLHETAL